MAAIETDLKNNTLLSIGRFPQEGQAAFNVLAAKSLGIKLEGNDNLEKQKPYLMALRDGYKILYKLSLPSF